MPLFQWLHRRTCSLASPTLKREEEEENEKSIPTLTIQVDHRDAVPFPTASISSRLRRVASSCFLRSPSPATVRPSTERHTLSISTVSPRQTSGGRGGGGGTANRGLKKFISYPVLRSSSSPISPMSSSEESWGMRQSFKGSKSSSSSIYSLEEILGMSLCPPRLFADCDEQQYSRPSQTRSPNHDGSDDGSISLSLFDDDDNLVLLRSPSSVPTFYPHQPVAHTASRPHSRNVSTSRSIPLYFPRSTTTPKKEAEEGEEEEKFTGFSFAPTPSASTAATPISTPAPSLHSRDDDDEVKDEKEVEPSPPTTPKLSSSTIFESIPLSPLSLPPSLHSSSQPCASTVPSTRRSSLARNSGQWLTSPTSPSSRSRLRSVSLL